MNAQVEEWEMALLGDQDDEYHHMRIREDSREDASPDRESYTIEPGKRSLDEAASDLLEE